MSDDLTGPRRWEKVGQSIYRRLDSYVWREGREWFRCDLPPWSMRTALASLCIGPFGIFSRNSGPYSTMAAAKKGK